jgi:hypothetical protein
MRRMLWESGVVAVFALSLSLLEGCAATVEDGVDGVGGTSGPAGGNGGNGGNAGNGGNGGNGGAGNSTGSGGNGGNGGVIGNGGSGGDGGGGSGGDSGTGGGGTGGGGTGGGGTGGGGTGGAGTGGGGTGGAGTGGGGTGGTVGTGTGGTNGTGGGGKCCASGDCLCHGPDPTAPTSAKGSYQVANYTVTTGRIYHPTNAEPPLAGIAIIPGFTNTGPEMNTWGEFYASHGIVGIVTNAVGLDSPDIRATKLLGAIASLKAENTKSGGPLNGKMAGRYGTSGYSMGGGGTTIATATDKTLKSSVGLAPWAPVGAGVTTPTLLLCGSVDLVAPCSHADSSYSAIPNTTQKMQIVIDGAEHLASWFQPTQAGGRPAEAALAFNKVYLEGDERWKPILMQAYNKAMTKKTNIQ